MKWGAGVVMKVEEGEDKVQLHNSNKCSKGEPIDVDISGEEDKDII